MGPLGWFISGYIAKDFLGSDEKKEKFKLKTEIENNGFLFCDASKDLDDIAEETDDDDEDDEDEEEDEDDED